jgi:hypothetical protein
MSEQEKVGYAPRLDADRQITAEEKIAEAVFEIMQNMAVHGEGGEETAAQAGRDILYQVLREFRPDLFDDAVRPVLYCVAGEYVRDRVGDGDPAAVIDELTFDSPDHMRGFLEGIEYADGWNEVFTGDTRDEAMAHVREKCDLPQDEEE